MRITPVRGAAIVTVLYGCVFAAAFRFAMTSKDPWSVIFPIVIAAPTSLTPLGTILLRPRLCPTEYQIIIISIGIINGGVWFGLVFVLGTVTDWIKCLFNRSNGGNKPSLD